MTTSTAAGRPYPNCPLAVAYGLGVDSTANNLPLFDCCHG